MRAVKIIRMKITFILLASFLTGCAIQLAPRYDAALFEGITDVNVEIMELFASVSTGTESSDCDARLDSYNSAIGSVDALALQSRARPIPKNSVTDEVNEFLESRGMGSLTIDVAPGANSLEAVSTQLAKMKEVDCNSGLKASVVEVFRNAVIISMDQAITYESFLNR